MNQVLANQGYLKWEKKTEIVILGLINSDLINRDGNTLI